MFYLYLSLHTYSFLISLLSVLFSSFPLLSVCSPRFLCIFMLYLPFKRSRGEPQEKKLFVIFWKMLPFPLSFFFHSFFLLILQFLLFPLFFLVLHLFQNPHPLRHAAAASTSSRALSWSLSARALPPAPPSPGSALLTGVAARRDLDPLSKLPFRVDARPKLFEFSDMLRYRCTAAFIAPRFIALFMLISVLQYHSISFYKRFVAFLSLYICFIHHASATSILHLSLFCASIHFLNFLFFFFFLFFYPLSFLLLAFKWRR